MPWLLHQVMAATEEAGIALEMLIEIRNKITDATDFMGWYMDESTQKLGISKWDAQAQYLAYHEGRSGYANQSYLGKPWLMDVSAKVAERAEMYRGQLASCGRL